MTKTVPLSSVISRQIENEKIKIILDEFADHLEELVNFGSHILQWSADAAKGGDEHALPLLSLRNMLEIVDSISILIRQSSVDPCKLLLRGFLESSFALEYIFQKDFKQRSLSYIVWLLQENLKEFQAYDATSTSGKTLRDVFSKDPLAQTIAFPKAPADLKKRIEEIQNALKKPEYKETVKSYHEMKKKMSRPPWFSLNSGPRNVKELADKLHKSALYEILYRSWSGMTHGTDIVMGKISKDGIYQIRYIKDAQSVTQWTINLSLGVYGLFLKHYIPHKHKEFRIWYLDFRPFFMTLDKPKYVVK